MRGVAPALHKGASPLTLVGSPETQFLAGVGRAHEIGTFKSKTKFCVKYALRGNARAHKSALKGATYGCLYEYGYAGRCPCTPQGTMSLDPNHDTVSTVNNRKAVNGASVRLLFRGAYFLCEGAALNLPQGTMSLDPFAR